MIRNKKGQFIGNPKIKYKCKQCGKIFWEYKQKNRCFCSVECRIKTQTGKKLGQRIVRIIKKCLNCKKPFSSLESQSQKYCSVSCFRTYPRRWKTRKRVVTKDGYINIFEPTHPLAMSNGYVQEHRMFWYDAGRPLKKKDHLHHKNWDKTDNRLENLERITSPKHTKKYGQSAWDGRKRNRKLRKCKICGKETYALLGLCRTCYVRLWARKRYGYKKSRFRFKTEGLI